MGLGLDWTVRLGFHALILVVGDEGEHPVAEVAQLGLAILGGFPDSPFPRAMAPCQS